MPEDRKGNRGGYFVPPDFYEAIMTALRAGAVKDPLTGKPYTIRELPENAAHDQAAEDVAMGPIKMGWKPWQWVVGLFFRLFRGKNPAVDGIGDAGRDAGLWPEKGHDPDLSTGHGQAHRVDTDKLGPFVVILLALLSMSCAAIGRLLNDPGRLCPSGMTMMADGCVCREGTERKSANVLDGCVESEPVASPTPDSRHKNCLELVAEGWPERTPLPCADLECPEGYTRHDDTYCVAPGERVCGEADCACWTWPEGATWWKYLSCPDPHPPTPIPSPTPRPTPSPSSERCTMDGFANRVWPSYQAACDARLESDVTSRHLRFLDGWYHNEDAAGNPTQWVDKHCDRYTEPEGHFIKSGAVHFGIRCETVGTPAEVPTPSPPPTDGDCLERLISIGLGFKSLPRSETPDLCPSHGTDVRLPAGARCVLAMDASPRGIRLRGDGQPEHLGDSTECFQVAKPRWEQDQTCFGRDDCVDLAILSPEVPGSATWVREADPDARGYFARFDLNERSRSRIRACLGEMCSPWRLLYHE